VLVNREEKQSGSWDFPDTIKGAPPGLNQITGNGEIVTDNKQPVSQTTSIHHF